MQKKKVCLLGSFAVGKTSLIRRFVEDSYSETYQTTVGVRIHKKTVALNGESTELVVWDVHGEDELQKVRPAHFRGAHGLFLVADGTRRYTVEQALALHERVRETAGDVPTLFLVNKVDLRDDWELEERDLAELRAAGWSAIPTSAKDGREVEASFLELTRRMLER